MLKFLSLLPKPNYVVCKNNTREDFICESEMSESHRKSGCFDKYENIFNFLLCLID